MLRKEFKYFKDHQDLLVGQYFDKFVIIKDETVLESFDNEPEAYVFVVNNGLLGEALIQQCLPGSGAYSLRIYTPAFDLSLEQTQD